MQKERVAIVTGGTRGMGRAISVELAGRGNIVCAVYRSDHNAAQETQQLLQAINPRCGVYQTDICDEKAAHSLVEAIGAEFGRVDILVNNAGIFDFKFIDEMDGDYLDYVLTCNFKSQFYMLQAVVPFMKKNHYGRIVNASSISGRFADVGLIGYGASKAAVDMMTTIGSAELAPYGITVNAYAPGIIHTDMTHEMITHRGEEQVQDIAVRRFGTGEDVACLAAFLASEQAGYITGEIIGVDGGMFKVQNARLAYEHISDSNP